MMIQWTLREEQGMDLLKKSIIALHLCLPEKKLALSEIASSAGLILNYTDFMFLSETSLPLPGKNHVKSFMKQLKITALPLLKFQICLET